MYRGPPECVCQKQDVMQYVVAAIHLMVSTFAGAKQPGGHAMPRILSSTYCLLNTDCSLSRSDDIGRNCAVYPTEASSSRYVYPIGGVLKYLVSPITSFPNREELRYNF